LIVILFFVIGEALALVFVLSEVGDVAGDVIFLQCL